MSSVRRGTRAVVATMLAFVLTVSPALAQPASTTSDYTQGRVDGQERAGGSAAWILSGLACGLLGLIPPLLFVPNPPSHALVGKSSDYVLGYTDGYKSKSKSKNVVWAAVGAAVSIGICLAVDCFEYE